MAKILVVEDVKEIRTGIKTVLKSEGHEVVEATNGKDAEAKIKDNPYELVITDIYMPEQDGLSVIMALKQEHPDTKIIAITGDNKGPQLADKSEMLTVAKRMGASQTLPKPFDAKQLIETVNAVMNN